MLEQRQQLRIVVVGHVDHGKSTLIGRLFYDTGSLPDGKLEQIQDMCKRRSMPFEWSFLMDALQTERDQGITIDTAQIWFKTKKRDYVIIDAPGHKEFLKNMISGVANSEAAVLIIDVHEGIKEQSKKHAYLLHLLGIRQVVVLLNKMDAVEYSQEVFNNIKQEYLAYLDSLHIKPRFVIPISAREGDCIITGSKNMTWYQGKSFLDALDSLEKSQELSDQALRFAVQDVYKFDKKRIIVGRIESGKLNVGDEILVLPSDQLVKIKTIELHGQSNVKTVCADMSVGVTLEDQIFIERGNVISHKDNPPILSNIFKARIFWLSDKDLVLDHNYKIKINTAELIGKVKEIHQIIDTDNLNAYNASTVTRNNIAEVTFQVKGMGVFDDSKQHASTGHFVVVDNYQICGGGIVILDGIEDHRAKLNVKSTNIRSEIFYINREHRQISNGHKGGVIWMTGLSGAGKTTLANGLQKILFNKGCQVYVLDGDNIRARLNKDLGFSSQDRTENIRRIGEVAALFADAGFIVITALISPFRADRHNARAAFPTNFHSVYVNADIESCEARDTKGLYKKAKAGELDNFTGVSAPFEEPENCDLEINTTELSIDDSLTILKEYVEKYFIKDSSSYKLSEFSGLNI